MEYWANLPPEQLASECIGRVDDYYNWLLSTGRLARMRAAFDTYYGQRGQHNASHITSGGDRGELSFLMSAEYRSLVQHVLVMTTQSRTALEMVATNTDSVSKSQAYLAKGIVEYYRRDGGIDQNAYQAAEMSLILDTAWVFNEWDTQLGEELAPDVETGTVLRQGDIRSRARTPLDVVIDYRNPDVRLHDWRIVRDRVNKYDLAAQYPEDAESIIGLTTDEKMDEIFRFGEAAGYDASDAKDSNIDVWTFFHKKTAACPQGRMFQFATARNFFFDGPIPYRKLPGNRICPAEMILSPLGFSNMNTLMGLQDVLDALISAAVTNMTTCGVNNLWVPDPANLDFEELAKGMNIFGGAQKPEIVELAKLPPEWFNLANFVIGRLEAYSGVNSVARGNTEGKDFSGAAMALLQSMAIQFNSGFQRSVNKLVEDNGNDVIMLTQDFGKEPKLGLIVGKNNRYLMKKYSGGDIDQIQRVYCRQSNAIKDTTAGKLHLADKMAELGALKDPTQYAEIMETGNLDCLIEPMRNISLGIDEENEALLNGEIPPVVFTDNPIEHMARHSVILASPDDRKDQGLIERVRTHMQQHLTVWQQTDPLILQALNIPPYPMPMPQLGPDGQPLPPPPGGALPPPGPGAPDQALEPQTGITELPGPNMPENPLSGQEWAPDSGGLN